MAETNTPFHLNGNDEKNPCGAESWESCPFGGKLGPGNHFGSEAEAEAEVQRRHQLKNPKVKTLSKKREKPIFSDLRMIDSIGDGLLLCQVGCTCYECKSSNQPLSIDRINEDPAVIAKLIGDLRNGREIYYDEEADPKGLLIPVVAYDQETNNISFREFKDGDREDENVFPVITEVLAERIGAKDTFWDQAGDIFQFGQHDNAVGFHPYGCACESCQYDETTPVGQELGTVLFKSLHHQLKNGKTIYYYSEEASSNTIMFVSPENEYYDIREMKDYETIDNETIFPVVCTPEI